MEYRESPLILNRQELETFNRFYTSLSEFDREILSDILDEAEFIQPACDPADYPMPFLAYLLELLIRERKVILRINQRAVRRAAKQAKKLEKS